MSGDAGPELLEKVISVLEEMHVPYMIGGGMALTVWASPRMTHDIDIVVDMPQERIPEFCSHFSTDRYYIDAGVMDEAFRQRDKPGLGMYSFMDTDTNLKVDLFPLRADDLAQRNALSRRVHTEVVDGLRAYVYAPDDLLVQKLRWYAASQSERQLRDCLNLLLTDMKRPTPLISWDYVQDWANHLGPAVQQAWSLARAAAEQAKSEENQR